MEPPRPLPHSRRALGPAPPLVAAQGPREPDHPPARQVARGQPGQPRPLPRLPAARGTPAALPPVRPHARALPPPSLRRENPRLLSPLPARPLAPAPLAAWLAWPSRSRLSPFVRLAR